MPADNLVPLAVSVGTRLVLVAVPALIAAVGSVMTVRVARQNRAALNAQDDHMDTTNGATLGGTVHDMAATLEVLSAQVHLNTQEVLEARAMAEEAHSYVRRMVEEDHLHRRLPE